MAQDKEEGRRAKYGDKADVYNDVKYKGENKTDDRAEGQKPPA